ncbi:MAG TPA: hypothetical protein PKH77_15385 [Anaerolineae bacterium]|nr:hypothetical protein [Anaerolineae bacterium]
MLRKYVNVSVCIVIAVLFLVAVTALSSPQYVQATTWEKDSIDTGAYFVSLAFDSHDIPHLAYAWGGQIRYASKSGGSWITTTVVQGDYPALALDTYGRPHISYYNRSSGDLEYASWNGTAWSTSKVDSAGTVGVYTSLVLDSLNRPHISYADRDNGTLKYATFNGSGWVTETVDGGMAMYYEHSSVDVDRNNLPHIAYRSNSNLKFASKSGGSWSTQTIDDAGNTGSFCSLAFDNYDRPHISYWSYTDWKIKYATRSGAGWQIADVHSGSYSALAVDLGNHPHIVYWEGGQVKYGWAAENVGNAGSMSSENWRFDIAVNSAGEAGIVYWGDGISLTYAQRQAALPTIATIPPQGGDIYGADGVRIIFPDGCITDTVVVTYTPLSEVEMGGKTSTDYVFDLLAVYSNTGQLAQLVPGGSYTIVITYTNIDPNIENEDLGLYWWDETLGQWSQQGITSTVNITDNVITAQSSHFSLFAVLGEPHYVLTVAKSVIPTGQIRYGDELTYTLFITGAPGTEVGVYDPLINTTFVRFVEKPGGIEYANHAITGTMMITPTNQTTVSFVVKVGVPGTIGIYVDVSNTACIYPAGQTISMCEWSNTVTNQAYRPYTIFLPLVARNQ